MKFYREKISNCNFSKKRGQNILKLAHNVEKYLKIWNLGVSIGDTFFGLTGPSQTVCIREACAPVKKRTSEVCTSQGPGVEQKIYLDNPHF